MTESVLARVARGDAGAVRECIDEFGGLVWAIARRMTRSRADAEDAVQEIQDSVNQMSELTGKRLQSLLAMVHDWVSSYERSSGTTR